MGNIMGNIMGIGKLTYKYEEVIFIYFICNILFVVYIYNIYSLDT